MTGTRVVVPALFMLVTGLYVLTNYGGIRSPDSEVVFRTALAMADSQHTSPVDLEAWPKFGVARGVDGRWYSIYPPFESVVQVPMIAAARWMLLWGRFREAPASHYAGLGLEPHLRNEELPDKADHALRYAVSFFDVLISVGGVVMLYLMLLRFTGSQRASWLTAIVYAFGTLAWPYAGSFFSEPLATLLVLGSFYPFLDRLGPGPQAAAGSAAAISGACIGLAIHTHVTSLLFLPFVFLLAVRQNRAVGRVMPTIYWLAGLTVPLAAGGWYNHARFGSWLESGRALSLHNPVEWVVPLSGPFWHNLWGILFGAGKGIVFFCPILVMSALVWRTFHRARPWMSRLLIVMIVVRVLFNALYKEWHGGYSVGPRYLFMAIPFLMIPWAWWLKVQLEHGRLEQLIAAGVSAFLAMVQQWYFVAGELFSYYHLTNFANMQRGINVFVNDRLYLDWQLSPFGRLLDFKRGPFFMQSVPVSNSTLWLLGSLGLLIWVAVLAGMVYRYGATRPPARHGEHA